MSTVTTLDDESVELTLTCITGQDAGWYSGTTSYYVSYKLTSASSWSNTSALTCGSAIQVTGLTAVSSYTFAAYATNIFGTGPLTVPASYKTATTYGPPSTPERPTLTQNNDKTVTVSWAIPNPLNDEAGVSVTYKIEIKTKTSSYATLNASFTSTSLTPSTSFSMANLTGNSSYTNDDSGTPIKIRITATNNYGSSSASEENVDSAVYQGEPLEYQGAITVVQSGS